MDHTIWNQTPNSTNVGESAHTNVNRDGRNLSLLAGIIRHKNKSSSTTTSNVLKKRKSNEHNKANAIEIIDLDEDSHFEQQEKRN
ncbi:hypothetical protein C1645_813998 [Glomus cerebriforme]|uniref:Uncharacterized protein n=1 Tax=Glomus cerebriforme TaxID=658196 RepID=A0A397TRA6_9GLOM|nr:hypothetical protein C1645_813998 [Glomus cerebriforme]